MRLSVLKKDSSIVLNHRAKFICTSGNWVTKCNFAVIILTYPEDSFHLIEAGTVIQNMVVTAWNYDVWSGIFTGINKEIFK